MIKGCLGAFAMIGSLNTVYDIAPQKIQSGSGKIFLLRRAKKEDVVETTKLIQKSYSYWVERGLKVSPAFQDAKKTASHLLDGGMILENDIGKIVGTFTLEDGKISLQGDVIKAKFTNPSDHVNFLLMNAALSSTLLDGNYLVFKKLAIDPSLQKSGLGRRLYDIAEQFGRSENYIGMALETIVEAEWLYHWYTSMGFEVIGGVTYPNSEIETLLLKKSF